jgi:hypothetical protein
MNVQLIFDFCELEMKEDILYYYKIIIMRKGECTVPLAVDQAYCTCEF